MSTAQSSAPTQRVLRIRLWSELATVAIILTELIWISSFYSSLSKGYVSWGQALLAFGLIILTSHYLARGLNFANASLKTRRIVFAVWILVALFGSLRLMVLAGEKVGLFELLVHPFFGVKSESASFAEFWHLILVSILIWRGLSLARSPVSSARAMRSFQIGLLIFLAYGVMVAPFQTGQQNYFMAGLFLFSGIISLSFARIAGVSELRGGKAGKFSRAWILGIVLSTLVLVTLAILMGSLLRAPLSFILEKTTWLVFVLFSLLTLVIIFPVMWLFTVLAPLLDRLKQAVPPLEILEDLKEMLNLAAAEQQQNLPDLSGLLSAGQIAWRIGLVLVVLLVILLALRWKPLSRRNEGEEEVSDVPGSFKFPGLPALDPNRLLYRLTHARRFLAAAKIRQVYGELMDLCEKLNHPRPDPQTPLEFLPDLEAIFPEQTGELAIITQAYMKIRYGELPETQQEVDDVVYAWEAIRKTGRMMLAEHRRQLKEQKKQADKHLVE